MGQPGSEHDIILFYYEVSPYSVRLQHYLGLRGIKYSQCVQPEQLPRPDLAALGINHRRIPILAIGRDIYIDTRLMIEKLEELYPENRLGSTEPFNKGLEKLFEAWTIEGGPFWKTAAIMPSKSPCMNDPVWLEDRRQASGGHFTKDTLAAGRPAALVDVNTYFSLAEHGWLADGREYIFNTKEPSLGDVHAIWCYDWALHMQISGADESADAELLNAKRFPKVSAWVERFREAYRNATEKYGEPESVSSEDAKKRILKSDFAEGEGNVDETDPLQLRKGQTVEVRPSDFGFTHADTGTLVSLSSKETVIDIKVKEGEGNLRLHYPRTGFKITPVDQSA